MIIKLCTRELSPDIKNGCTQLRIVMLHVFFVFKIYSLHYICLTPDLSLLVIVGCVAGLLPVDDAAKVLE